MSLLLLVLGILLAGVGAATIGFGIPINELTLGNTLIVAGTAALVGGLLLIGLSAAVSELAAIAKRLSAQPPAHAARAAEPITVPVLEPPATREPAVVAREPAVRAATREPQPAEPVVAAPPADARPAPPVAPAPTLEVSASAIERLRSSIPRAERSVPMTEEVPLSPNGQHHPERPVEPQPRPVGAAAVETVREPRLDFLFRSRQAPARPSAQSQPESFDALWPKRPGRELPGEPRVDQRNARLEPALEDRRVAPAPTELVSAPVGYGDAEPTPPHQPTASPEIQRPVAILKSGVVDGMAYTLYADGSIEAQLLQGTVRFGSIAELRTHIEKNS